MYQPAHQEQLGVRCLAKRHFDTPRVGSNRQPSDCQTTALTSWAIRPIDRRCIVPHLGVESLKMPLPRQHRPPELHHIPGTGGWENDTHDSGALCRPPRPPCLVGRSPNLGLMTPWVRTPGPRLHDHFPAWFHHTKMRHCEDLARAPRVICVEFEVRASPLCCHGSPWMRPIVLVNFSKFRSHCSSIKGWRTWSGQYIYTLSTRESPSLTIGRVGRHTRDRYGEERPLHLFLYWREEKRHWTEKIFSPFVLCKTGLDSNVTRGSF